MPPRAYWHGTVVAPAAGLVMAWAHGVGAAP